MYNYGVAILDVDICRVIRTVKSLVRLTRQIVQNVLKSKTVSLWVRSNPELSITCIATTSFSCPARFFSHNLLQRWHRGLYGDVLVANLFRHQHVTWQGPSITSSRRAERLSSVCHTDDLARNYNVITQIQEGALLDVYDAASICSFTSHRLATYRYDYYANAVQRNSRCLRRRCMAENSSFDKILC